MNKLQKIEKFNKENNKLTYKKIESQLDLLVKGQEVNQQELRLGFIGLAKQNSELLDLNRELNQQLEIVVSELNAIKKEREEKAARREKWTKRKRLPKRDPINSEIYNLLIKESESPTYIATRTRIAICLLPVTGIHTQDDIEWIKHECAERHHELKYDSGYSEADERAQSRYDGYPWENKF